MTQKEHEFDEFQNNASCLLSIISIEKQDFVKNRQ